MASKLVTIGNAITTSAQDPSESTEIRKWQLTVIGS